MTCDSPTYENYRVTDDVFELWRQELSELDEDSVKFIETAIMLTHNEFDLLKVA